MNAVWTSLLVTMMLLVRPQDAADRVLELYDVRDLVKPGAAALGETDPEVIEAARQHAAEFLRLVVERCVLPEASKPTVLCTNGALVVQATRADQSAVDEYLRSLYLRVDESYEVQVRLVEFDGAELERLCPQGGAVVVDALPAGRVILEAPLVSIRPFEPGVVSGSRNTPYVASFREYAEVLPTRGRLVVPQIEEFSTGFELDAIAGPAGAGRVIVRLALSHTTVVEPIATRETPLGVVAEPELHVASAESTLELGAGALAVLPIPNGDAPRQAFVVEVRGPN